MNHSRITGRSLANPLLLGLYLTVLGAALAWIAALKPLWYDELFTWHVVQQEGPVGSLRALLGGADNGLPVDYWIRQASVALFGGSELAFRLPSILAYGGGLLCLWNFSRLRLTATSAWIAVLIPLATLSLYYATEGRAYALLLLFQALSLLSWQRAAEEPKSLLWPLLLFVALGASSLTHYFGLLNFLPVMAGEAFRGFRTGRWGGRIWLAIGLALLPYAVVPLFARNALEMKAAFWASHYDLSTPMTTYRWLFGKTLLPVLFVLLVAALLSRAALRERRAGTLGFQSHELVAIVVLLASPLVVLLMAVLFTGAMTPRYALVSCFGLALLAAQSLDLLQRRTPRLGVFLLAVTLVWSGISVGRAVLRVESNGEYTALAAALRKHTLPVAVDSPHRFLQSYHYLPASERHKLVYLSDRAESRRRLGHDNDEIAIENLEEWAPIRHETYEVFTGREHEFLVLADASRAWLLVRLEDEGADLRTVEQLGDLKIFRVTLPATTPD